MGVVTVISFKHVKLLMNKVSIINIGMSITFCRFGMSKIPIPHPWGTSESLNASKLPLIHDLAVLLQKILHGQKRCVSR